MTGLNPTFSCKPRLWCKRWELSVRASPAAAVRNRAEHSQHSTLRGAWKQRSKPTCRHSEIPLMVPLVSHLQPGEREMNKKARRSISP